MKYLCLILYLQMSFCTIDINIQELVYLADHMTAAECRRLFASLHFSSYDLPATLSDAEEKVPKDVPCVKLLIKWNSGEEHFEGKGKTHAEVEHRLRQIGKNDLADWLGTMVFHKLVMHVNKTLEDDMFFDDDKPGVRQPIFNDNDSRAGGEKWTTLDSILSVTLFSLFFIILAAFCRMLKLAFRRAKIKRKNCKDPEEIVDLLSADSAESDQETLYELEMENENHSQVSYKIDFEKEGSEESVK